MRIIYTVLYHKKNACNISPFHCAHIHTNRKHSTTSSRSTITKQDMANTVPFRFDRFHIIPFRSIRDNSIQFRFVPFRSFDPIPFDFILLHAIPSHPTPSHPIPSYLIPLQYTALDLARTFGFGEIPFLVRKTWAQVEPLDRRAGGRLSCNCLVLVMSAACGKNQQRRVWRGGGGGEDTADVGKYMSARMYVINC